MLNNFILCSISKSVAPLKEKLYLKLRNKEKHMEAKCCMLPRAHSGAEKTQNVPLPGWLCVLFFCLQIKSEKHCANRAQLTEATAMQLSRLESPQTPNT